MTDSTDRQLLFRAFVRASVREAQDASPPTTPRKLLQTIIRGRFTTDAQNGKTVIYRNVEGLPVLYPVPGSVVLNNAELFAIPGAAQTLGAVQALAYQRAQEQGL